MTGPRPLPHREHAKRDDARLFEVAYWVLRAMEHERQSGIGEFLTPAKMDFRGIQSVVDSFTVDDLPDDPLMRTLILKLHSGQEYRIIIEEK